MKTYKATLQNKATKDIIIEYPTNHSIEKAKFQLKAKYQNHTFKEVVVNKGPLVYYCNTCQKEILNSEKSTHTCIQK